jgi:DNA polymerase-4
MINHSMKKKLACREINTYEDYEQKSLSKETTLDFNTDDKHYLEKELYLVLERACSRMRKKKYLSNSLTVKVKYADFTVNQKSHIINRFSNIEMDFYEDSLALFDKLYRKGKQIRLVGVKFADLREDAGNLQEDMFVKEDKFKSLVENMDKLRKKYDYNVIKFGKTFDIWI